MCSKSRSPSILLTLLINCLKTISQDNFFIHTFEDANEGFLHLPYANGHCTLTGNDLFSDYYFFDCEFNGDSFYCNNNADNTCQASGQCDPGSFTASYDPTAATQYSIHYGECPDDLFGINTNYAQIVLYSSSQSTNDGCPSSVDFTSYGTIYIATNICVLQNDTTYLMMTCDGFQAQINVYNDNICTQYNDTLIQYSRLCDYYTGGGTSNTYQRLESCKINDNEQLQPTLSPTNNPTLTPSTFPSSNPTIFPTFYPSINPTISPTMEPTINPTYNPSITPSKSPAMEPTVSPSESESNIQKIPHTESVISDLDNITLLYIIFGVLLMFYFFICFYIWCNEKRKRSYLTFNFQRENDIDKKERMQYLAANGRNGDYYDGHVEVDPAPINNVELQGFDNVNNVVLLDDDGHREALMNEGFIA